MKVFILAVACLAVVAAAAFADVAGEYTGQGSNPGGAGSYDCDVTVAKSGDVYNVQWFFKGKLGYEGVGFMKNGLFCVGYASSGGYGVVVYEVKSDGTLDGVWTGAGATALGAEVLKKK